MRIAAVPPLGKPAKSQLLSLGAAKDHALGYLRLGSHIYLVIHFPPS